MRETDSLLSIKGIGEKAQQKYQKLNINTVGDLLEHYPRNYDVYKPICPIRELVEGEVCAVEGVLDSLPKMRKVRKLKILSCSIQDGTGIVRLTWFNMPFVMSSLHSGTRYIFRGKVIRKNGVLVIEQPQMLTKEQFYNNLNKLQPVYSLTAGLSNHAISKAIAYVLKEGEIQTDYLPVDLRKKYHLIERKKALRGIHFPKNKEEMIDARRRIVFDEFFLFVMALNQLKEKKEKRKNAYQMKAVKECEQLLASLPYKLTKAQLRAWEQVQNDLVGEGIMNRLIQGDVGSGKTIIAILALLFNAKNGHQGAIMVPTEVLAKQHLESFQEMLSPFGIRIALLVGSMTAKEKREVYKALKEHEIDIVIGTHALIQEKVEYADLSLVITDEQHRFGVKQRENFAGKGNEAHILVMSATPIPRTLAIILYGDLDLTVIDELPGNRLPIKNCVVNTGYRPNAYAFIDKQVREGRQAYVICPMVEESENMEAENVIDYTEQLRSVLPMSIQIEYLHGKMKPKEKNAIMERFAAGEIQVLVSTTVVEVGINVPNATVMLIENCERFGLAQLHQLRGRVGRGKYQSYCIFMTGHESKETKKRMEIMGKSNDGFLIAEQDLKLRGPGDLFGIRQSGLLEFKMADVFQDSHILKEAYEAAKEVSEGELIQIYKKYERLREKLYRYTDELSL